MGVLTIAGHEVLEATIVLRLRGNWRVDLTVATDGENLTGEQIIDDDGLGYQGTIQSGGLDHTRWIGRMVGGANKLGSPALPRPYRETTAGIVMKDLATELGERLSLESDPLVLAYLLAQWMRFGNGEDAIEELIVEKIGANWRVLRDGSIWVGIDTFPEVKVEHVVVDKDDDRKVWTVATERSDLEPGVTFEGRQVVQVVHRIGEDGLRSEVSFGD